MSHGIRIRRLLLATATTIVFATVAALGARTPAIAKRCQDDLARRLHLQADQVSIARIRAVDWPDAALGLRRAGSAYAQVIIPGWSIILKADGADYLYTASASTFRYGGPIAGGRLSVLYLAPMESEPNLNEALMQVSLSGTNPTLVLGHVNDFRPQSNGSILATRRTSRSGSVLLYLAPGKTEKALRLAGAFDFADPVLGPDGRTWAAYTRLRAGGPWKLMRNGLSVGADKTQTIDLPEKARPRSLYWDSGRLIAGLSTGHEDDGWYELRKAGTGWRWERLNAYVPPERRAFMFNRSTALAVRSSTVNGKPSTRVVVARLRRPDKQVATLRGFVCQRATVGPRRRFVFLSGMQGQMQRAYAVDLHSGETLLCLRQRPGLLAVQGRARLFAAPPYDWLHHRARYGL